VKKAIFRQAKEKVRVHKVSEWVKDALYEIQQKHDIYKNCWILTTKERVSS
jgi:hypothetical protein